jgi:hypothetical protein
MFTYMCIHYLGHLPPYFQAEVIQFLVNFCEWCEESVKIHFLAYAYPILPEPFIESMLIF